MKKLALLLLTFIPMLAFAQAGWNLTSFSVKPSDAPAFVAAIDKLMASKEGKAAKGRLLLQATVVDGLDPSTHSLVALHHSLAEREALLNNMMGSAAWTEFQATVEPIAQLRNTMRGAMLMSFGDVTDTDRVWQNHVFGVTNPVAFVAALNRFKASETFKRFPGQVHLQAFVAGQPPGATHVISVGYASETEMEQWLDSAQNDDSWIAYLLASGNASSYLGSSIDYDVKAWGPASMQSFAP